MTKEVLYRCKNTGGPDGDCEHATSNETLSASAVTFNDNGEAICPGETVFGEKCGAVLEEVIPQKKLPLGMISVAIVGLVVVVGAISFFLSGSDALLNVNKMNLSFLPGETIKVEISNKGEDNLKLDDVTFSDDKFSIDKKYEGLEVAPNEHAYIPVKFANHVEHDIHGSMTINSNSSNGPVTIDLLGSSNPWSIIDSIDSTSPMLDNK
ncbi:hypothetical protein [Photobacterium leiognathi]|uniref:hypothetical protein n=1 Tax=Photobacterium leiognathi TaxID=553611 RepID=UPI00298241EE|nr:hypothetical protein [Photobacterium leiognathi]